MKQLSLLFGLKSSKSIYKKIKVEEIPVARHGKRGIYLLKDELIEWAIEKEKNKFLEYFKIKYKNVRS